MPLAQSLGVVAHAPKVLRIEQVPAVPPSAGEVVIAIEAGGICGSDNRLERHRQPGGAGGSEQPDRRHAGAGGVEGQAGVRVQARAGDRILRD
jgi:L-idonate 5-dehydrogenase